MANKGILLGEDGDILVRNGGMVIGDTTMQEVGIIISMHQGEQKFAPVLGTNLVTNMRGSQREERIKRAVKINLAMDGKDYDAIKNKIKIKS